MPAISKRTIIIGGSIVIAALLIVIGVLLFRYMQLRNDTAGNTDAIIQRVAALYLVPTNETPTIAQVKDERKLQEQPFFAGAQDGDYILVYSKNKLALIYRKEVNKLVNVGPINTE